MSRIKKVLLILFRLMSVPYMLLIVFVTLIFRLPIHEHIVKPPFWELQEVMNGNIRMLFDIILNTLMLVPFGFFVPLWIRKADKPWKAALAGLIASLIIEIIQLATTRGFFEIDDLLHNTLGAFFGGILGCLLAQWIYSPDSRRQK